MSTKGSITQSRITASWEEIEQDGLNHSIRWTITATNNGTSTIISSYDNPAYITLQINGTTVASRVDYPTLNAGVTKQVRTGIVTVTRDSSTNTGTVRMTLYVNGAIFYKYENGSTSADVSVAGNKSNSWTIYSQTTGGAPLITNSADYNFIDEENPVITYSYEPDYSLSSAVLEIGISTDGNTVNIPYKQVKTVTGITSGSYTYELTDDDREQLWQLIDSDAKAYVYFFIRAVETYASGEVITTTDSHRATVNFVNYMPSLNPILIDINPRTVAATDNENYFVAHRSIVQFDLGATLPKGGEVSSCYIQNGNDPETGGIIIENMLTGTLEAPTSNTFYFSLTDSRGFTVDKMISYDTSLGEFIEYVPLTIVAKHTPLNSAGEIILSTSGNYFDKYFSADNKNKISITLEGTADDETTVFYTEEDAPVTVKDGIFTYKFTVEGLDYTKKYDMKLTVSDLVTDAISTFVTLSKPLFDWGEKDFAFNIPVTVLGKEVAAFENGYSAPWYYRIGSNGIAECWARKTVSCTTTSESGGFYSSGLIEELNLTYPFEFAELPVVNVTAVSNAGASTALAFQVDATGFSYSPSTTQTGRWGILAADYSMSSRSYTLNYHIIGRYQ